MAAIMLRVATPLDRQAPQVPQTLSRIVAKALAKNPIDRWASAEDFHRALVALRTEISTAGSGPAAAAPRATAHRWWLAAAAVAVLAIAGVIALRGLRGGSTVQRPSTPAAPRDVASGKSRLVVLPFENLTRDAADDWLAGGLSDSLTFGLHNLDSLILATRERITEVYRQQQVHEAAPLDPDVVRSLVQALGAQYYVHGTYQRVGDQIRVVARLVSAETGDVKAQESVTDRFANILKVEDDLATLFAAKLDAAGGTTRPAAGTSSVEAYRAFSEAQSLYLDMRAPATVEQRLREAIEFDPRYAQAWALMSKHFSRRISARGPTASQVDVYSREASRAAERAVEIDPSLYDAHIALALAHRQGYRTGPWRSEAQKAIELNPRIAEAYSLLADSYNASPNWSCSRDRNPALTEEYYRAGAGLDPRPRTYLNLVDHLVWNREFARALDVVNTALAAAPDNDSWKGRRVYALLALNRPDDARATLSGMTGGRMVFEDAIANGSTAIDDFRAAFVFMATNFPSRAIPHLEHAFALEPGCREYVTSSRTFEPLRNTREFAAFIARTR
jgi:TolB-like protein